MINRQFYCKRKWTSPRQKCLIFNSLLLYFTFFNINFNSFCPLTENPLHLVTHTQKATSCVKLTKPFGNPFKNALSLFFNSSVLVQKISLQFLQAIWSIFEVLILGTWRLFSLNGISERVASPFKERAPNYEVAN